MLEGGLDVQLVAEHPSIGAPGHPGRRRWPRTGAGLTPPGVSPLGPSPVEDCAAQEAQEWWSPRLRMALSRVSIASVLVLLHPGT
jgi:hypothetical protein